MKGTITKCLADWICECYGRDKWKAVLEKANAGARSMMVTVPIADIEDSLALDLFAAAEQLLGLDKTHLADGFGEYWCCTYAPKLYGHIVSRYKNSRELIVAMDHVHVQLTKSMPNARPPRFDYHWEGPNRLLVSYKSDRNLLWLYIGLARGVGKYFGESLHVTRINDSRVRIEFPPAS